MAQIRSKLPVCLAVAGLALAFSACPKKSPEARVIEARGNYSLQPTGFLVRELETEAVTPEEAGEEVAVAAEAAASAEAVAVAAEAAAEEAAEGEVLDEETAIPQGPRSVEVMFDLLVRFNSSADALPGITVEIVQNDASQNEKAKYLEWVETEGLRKGEARQVPIRLEVENYEDGDEFSVEWNEFVPPEKRGDYREFAEAGGKDPSRRP